MEKVFVTGATGTVGFEVLSMLRDLGYPARAGTRYPTEPDRRPEEGLEYVYFDFSVPVTYESALRGVKKLFLVRPPEISDTRKYLNPVVDAARAAGVEHVVFLSILGADRNPIVPHRRVEEYLRSSGLRYTFLRASFFMQNLATTHRADIRDRGEIFVPAGKGRTSFVDARDVAGVAVKALTEPGHEDNAYSLTGSEALDYFEVAQVFSSVLSRRVVYPNPSLVRFAWTMYRRGVPLSFVLVMGGIYTTARFGLAGAVTQDTARLLGRPPITMRAFVEDYRDAWT